MLSSQFKLDNKDGIAEALKKLVRYYPKAEYWENLLDIYRRKDSSDRVTLGFYRLMNDVGMLKDRRTTMSRWRSSRSTRACPARRSRSSRRACRTAR